MALTPTSTPPTPTPTPPLPSSTATATAAATGSPSAPTKSWAPTPTAHARLCRVEGPGDLPPEDDHVLDVALLDMNFGYPNLGHDCLVAIVDDEVRALAPTLRAAGLAVRVVSFAVRHRGAVPEPGARFGLILGTGGPGHIDPSENDGRSPWCQHVVEDVPWEPAAHRLFEAVRADPDAAMLAVCHSFGVLCRWLGVARPTLRGPEKGGKSKGVQQVELTEAGRRHPWFARFAGRLEAGRRLRVSDSRLFDLIPDGRPLPAGVAAIAHEVLPGGERGDALTMLELARDAGGVMPRFLAVNSHPEVYDPHLQTRLIDDRIARGGVTEDWIAERRRGVDALLVPQVGERVRLTAHITLVAPLRYHLTRLVRRRCERLIGDCPVHEAQVLAAA